MHPFIYIRCPGCNARIKAPLQLIGQRRTCPGYGQYLLVQTRTPDDAGPLLLDDLSAAPDQLMNSVKGEEKVILLVDDDREPNDGLRSLLEKRGHRVIQTFDGGKAKEMVHQQRPNLMILDMMMPHLGGYPVLEYFHKKPQAPPVIMITAKEGPQHKVYAAIWASLITCKSPSP
jgi:CheY-like chemotaxis protein